MCTERKITFNVFNPQCAANASDRFLTVVRNGGLFADQKLSDTKEEAERWGSAHNGEVSSQGAQAYSDMIHRWANK